MIKDVCEYKPKSCYEFHENKLLLTYFLVISKILQTEFKCK